MDIAKAHVARQVMAIRPHCNIPSKFIETVLQGQFTKIREQMNGLIPGISRDVMLNLLFPLPPLAEQQRIVEQIEPLLGYVDIIDADAETLEKSIALAKQKILDLAIRGKLVPQDPTDEPASELLKKIKAEKEDLIKAGKIKKDKHESYIFKGDDNKYYEIIDGKQTLIDSAFDFPESWQVVRLRSICLLSDGVKQTGSQVCLDAKYLRGKSSPTYLQQGKFVEKGNNIILVDGENSGEVFTAPIAGYMGSTFKHLWISENLYLPYILAFIRYYKDELRNSKKGAAIPHLNKDIFNNLIIGIPPYDEQVRIVDRLNSITSSLN
jgi:type I restriction enzyme S subunit